MPILNREYLIKKYGGISNLNEQTSLHLDESLINDLDENTFVDLANLKGLHLGSNRLKRLKAVQFKSIINLETLNLTKNQIDELDENVFAGLTNLKKLYFYENKLRIIKANQFRGLDNLEILWLQNNQIEELNENAFQDLTSLSELDLQSNKLKRIDRECFAPLKSISLIDLRNNEFSWKCVSFGRYDRIPNGEFESNWNRFLLQFANKTEDYEDDEIRTKKEQIKRGINENRINYSEISQFIDHIGIICRNLSRYEDALRYFRQSHEISIQTLPFEDLHVATSLHNFGSVYAGQGKHEEAIECFRESLEMNRQRFEPNHPEIAKTVNSIGESYYKLKRYDQALISFSKVIDRYDNKLPPNDPLFATVLKNIGLVHAELGNHETALRYLNQSLVIVTSQTTLVENHSKIGKTLYHIANVYKANKNKAEALKYFEKSIKIYRQVLRPDHPDIRLVENNIESTNNKTKLSKLFAKKK